MFTRMYVNYGLGKSAYFGAHLPGLIVQTKLDWLKLSHSFCPTSIEYLNVDSKAIQIPVP